MLSVLIARLSSPVSSCFFPAIEVALPPPPPCFGEARVSQTKWANQRMSTDIECAWSQPWSCIPLLSVSHSARKRSRSHRISLFTSFLLSTFNYYFISLQRSVSKSHLKFLMSPRFPATSPSYPSPYTCSCVCVCLVGFIMNDSDWHSSPLPQRQTAVSQTWGAASSHRHLSLKAIHIRMGPRREQSANRGGTVSEAMRKWKCIYLSVRVKDGF